jgi:transcriptional regulator with XRE-family HTH domain
MDENSNLANNLHKLMSDARLTSSELGRHLNLPAATIKKLRTGENKNPTIATLSPIAKHFRINISQLIGEEPLIDHNQTLLYPSNHNNHISYNSDMFTHAVPLINWNETITWHLNQTDAINRQQIVVGQSVSKQAYALLLHTNYSLFRKDGIIIVEPIIDLESITNIEPASNTLNLNKMNPCDTYVLIYKTGQTMPSIKKVLAEDGNLYMQSLIPELNTTLKLTDEYKILGNVIAYKHWFYPAATLHQ